LDASEKAFIAIMQKEYWSFVHYTRYWLHCWL
jgi:hypothetical protein